MALFDNVETKSAVGTGAVEAQKGEKTAKQLKKDAKKANLEKILEYIADEKNKVPADIVQAAKDFKPSFFGITTFGGGFAKKEHPAHVEKLFKLLGVDSFEAIKVGAHFDEMKAFTTLKVGRKEMHKISIDLIKKPDDKGAIYLDFDADKGVYTIKGIGAQPEGWTGYVPAQGEAEDAE